MHVSLMNELTIFPRLFKKFCYNVKKYKLCKKHALLNPKEFKFSLNLKFIFFKVFKISIAYSALCLSAHAHKL